MRRLLLLGTVLLLACGRGGESSYEEATAPPPPEMAEMPASDAGALSRGGAAEAWAQPAPVPTPAPRQIVRNAQLSLVVESPPAAADRLARMADSLGGYAGDVRAERRDELMYYWIVLRVPSERLDTALAAIKDLAIRIESEALQAEDVTEQHVELDARLKTLVATETELQALLAESRARRADVEEIMSVYRELTGIRTQIEQTRAQLETLDSRVALSTITIELAPEAGSGPIVSDRWQPGATLRSAARALLGVLQGLVDLAIYAVVVGVPILALLAIPILAVFLLARRLFRKRAA
jgi:uncharacterized protein DUF4349